MTQPATVRAVHMECTLNTADKFYRVYEFEEWVATNYGPRGRAGSAGTLSSCASPHYEFYEVCDKRTGRGYERVFELHFAAPFTEPPGRAEALILLGEAFDAAIARELRGATLRLESAVAGPATEQALVVLPDFAPAKGRVGGLRDARPWGSLLAAALHTQTVDGRRNTYAVVDAAVAAWATQHYPRSRSFPIGTCTVPDQLVSVVADLVATNPNMPLADLVEVSAAALI